MIKGRLENLMKMLMEQASYVSKMIELCLVTINDKIDNSQEIRSYEEKVNELENKLEEECIYTIALNQPEAIQLRTIVAIMKANVNLERLADLAENISSSTNKIMHKPIFAQINDLEKIGRETKKMLDNAISAISEMNPKLANQVCEDDEVVDYLNRKIINDLLKLDYSSYNLSELFHVVRISRAFERIADLTTNIAEDTIYASSGMLIKHGAGIEEDKK